MVTKRGTRQLNLAYAIVCYYAHFVKVGLTIVKHRGGKSVHELSMRGKN